MTNPVAEKFSEFYEKWIWKLEEILHQLLEVSKQRNEVVKSDEEVQALVSTVTSHLKEYYTVKWATAREDVLVFFSSEWLSPLENAYQWMTGWKPSSAFRALENLKRQNSSFVMTEEQQKKVEELRKRIKMEEEKMERDMERQQVALADRNMLELAKLTTRTMIDGGSDEAVAKVDGMVDVALKGVMAGLEKVMKGSDCVRLKTLKGILDLFSPMQSLDFLAAIIAVQLRLRQWGKERDMSANSLNIQDN